MKNSTKIRTHVFDLDWNRHVTSRVYEKFSQQGRSEILKELGYPIRKCMEEELVLIPEFTQMRFLSQQFSGSELRIDSEVAAYRHGRLLWDHKIYGEDNSLACELKLVTKSQKGRGENFSFLNGDEDLLPQELNHQFNHSCKQLVHDYFFPYSDLNCFMRYSPDAIWKVFEEGRWLFFSKVVDTTRITTLDTTSFFMGGKLYFFQMPKEGEKTKIHTWIESIEKIRFYLRQDLVSESGTLLASMRDEQLFVALSTSRPKKAPLEFVAVVKDYVELTS